MTSLPLATCKPNTWDFFDKPMIVPTGFREYDARWLYPEQINLTGFTTVGLAIGTQMHKHACKPTIVVGHDYRAYSLAVKHALIIGLMQAGIQVLDIGTALSPMVYFAQFHCESGAMVMITASHNPNGWTGIKVGFPPGQTHNHAMMQELAALVLQGQGRARAGGHYKQVANVLDAYINDVCGDFKMQRRLRVVCATGNGTCSYFAPRVLKQIGIDVVPLHNDLDYSFPHYTPNPEAITMLDDMAAMVRSTHADMALGFDGDGDRCGLVDDQSEHVFADKVGLILARHFVQTHAHAQFVVDIKSTGLFVNDPVLSSAGAAVEYWKTGHSHMKQRIAEIGALAGFEKSGHFFFAPPIGPGYDCGLRTAVEICKLMDANPNASFSDLKNRLPKTWITPTLSPACDDGCKYTVVQAMTKQLLDLHRAQQKIAGHAIAQVLTVNGARVVFADGGFALVRASSNSPNLVIVCESTQSETDLRAIFTFIDTMIHMHPQVGAYDQTF